MTVRKLMEDCGLTMRSKASEAQPTAEQLTPRQRELGELLAALLVADYKAFPPSSVNSAAGLDRNPSSPVPETFTAGLRQ